MTELITSDVKLHNVGTSAVVGTSSGSVRCDVSNHSNYQIQPTSSTCVFF